MLRSAPIFICKQCIVHERQQAHTYLDQLPPAQLSAFRSLLETMLDPVTQILARAPIDDEPFTEQDRQAVAEADRWLQDNIQGHLVRTLLCHRK